MLIFGKPAAVGLDMIPKIKNISALEDFTLKVLFDDGKQVLYDVNSDIAQIEDFKQLKLLPGFWGNFQIDESRTCVFWNDRIDLPSDTIYEYGVVAH